MELKIEQGAIEDVVKAAILEQLGEQGRRNLIEASLSHLLSTPKSTSYGYQQVSVLQAAFNDAVSQVARKIIVETLTNDEDFHAKVRVLIGDALIKMDQMNFSTYLADALGAALKR
jgi:hypothetical protein